MYQMPPQQPQNQPQRRTEQIYPKGHVPPPMQPPPTPPFGHGRPPRGLSSQSSRVGLLIVAVVALLVFLLIGLSVIGSIIPDGDPNKGVISLAMVLGSIIALTGIIKLLRNP